MSFRSNAFRQADVALEELRYLTRIRGDRALVLLRRSWYIAGNVSGIPLLKVVSHRPKSRIWDPRAEEPAGRGSLFWI